jgi:hypothetical protein
MPTFEVAGDPDLAVRVHRTVITRVMTDPQLRARFAPLFTSVLQTRMASLVENDEGGANQPPKLAIGSEWFAFDVSRPAATKSVLRIAAENNEQQQLR